MSATRTVYAAYQNANPEKINHDLIYMRRTEISKAEKFFEDLFTSLKIPHITFVSSQLITDEYEQRKYLPTKSRMMEESRLDLIIAKFRLEAEGETKELTFMQYFPKLVDDFFFHLSGNRYFALYQLSDKSFYSTSKGLFLKTLLMPLGIKFEDVEFMGESGETYKGLEYKLDPFRGKGSDVKNMLLYYFVEYGDSAIDYIFNQQDSEEKLVFFEEHDEDIEYEGYDSYKIKKGFSFFFLKEATEDQNFVNLLCTLMRAVRGTRKGLDTLFTDTNYLKKRILNTTATNTTKADKAILSIKRILDEVTKEKLVQGGIEPEYTENTFAIAKYMAWNFTDLIKLDTVSLENRRLRLFEYMVYPLLNKLSDATYRILNSRNLTMKRLENVFSAIRPGFIIKNLVTNELLRYHNATSTLEMFSVALRYSARGPQALTGGVLLKFRAVHPSYVGLLSLSFASASDPGVTGTFCPLTKRINDFAFDPVPY